MPIAADIQSLNPGAIITLFELDATSLGDSVYRFHAGTNELYNSVVWQTNTYTPMPIEASGFELSTQGTLPRPVLRVANITGVLGALVHSLNDLVGAKITRKRTLVKYLDAVNFTGGVNPTADSTQYFNDEIFFINRKVNENKVFIEFELASALEVNNVKLPRRQIVANLCQWTYRSAECSYAGGAVADANDNPTAALATDVCGKRVTSCKLRFGSFATLPFGNFPGSGLL